VQPGGLGGGRLDGRVRGREARKQTASRTRFLLSDRKLYPILLVLSALFPSAARGTSLTIIPDCVIARLSGNGRVLIGRTSDPAILSSVIRWSAADGTQFFEGPSARFAFTDVSYDGSVAVGNVEEGYIPDYGPYERTFRWTSEGGFDPLPHYYEVEYGRYTDPGVSGDGETVLGAQVEFQYEIAAPLTWVAGIPKSPFRPLPAPYAWGAAVASNYHASIIYGWLSETGVLSPQEFFRWTPTTGTVVLPSSPLVVSNNQIVTAAPQSGFVLGYARFADEWHSYVWPGHAGIEIIPNIEGDVFFARDMSADGQTIVGDTFGEVWVWWSDTGFLNVADWITNDLQQDLMGWELRVAVNISDDGDAMSFTANRLTPSLEQACVVLDLPEPPRAAQLFAGIAFLLVVGRLRRPDARSRIAQTALSA
jgi:hypothetical protein